MRLTTIVPTGLIVSLLASASGAAAPDTGHAMRGGAAPVHRQAEACATEFAQVVAEGRGFGLAFPADRNGYPGPMHVIELREQLGLTPAQVARAEALTRAMLDEARPRAADLLAADARLERLFADGRADEASVRAAVADVERARAALRLAHLLTHVRARDVLTDDQRRLYGQARWPASGR